MLIPISWWRIQIVSDELNEVDHKPMTGQPGREAPSASDKCLTVLLHRAYVT